MTIADQDAPTVSVIIPAYTMDRWDLLCDAVASARHQSLPAVEVIVAVDNNPELFAAAAARWPPEAGGADVPIVVLASDRVHNPDDLTAHVKAHGSRRRFGAGEARNSAAAVAQGQILAFLDDDARAAEDWLAELVRCYNDDGVLAVGGAPLPRYESARPAWMPHEFDWVFGCAYRGLPEHTAPVRHLIGANMSVRADALKDVGGFHSIDFDDMDMCHRISALGGDDAIVFTPSSVVHHYVPASRVTWRYFWRRCLYVNREKVRAFAEMGGAANLEAERKFVARSITRSVAREGRSMLRGDRAAGRRLGAVGVGVLLAGFGHLWGRVKYRHAS